jgi:hypothetical protein
MFLLIIYNVFIYIRVLVMTIEKNKLIELTMLLNDIESVGIEEIRNGIGELKCNFSSFRDRYTCDVSAYVDVSKVSPDLQVFVRDAITKLNIFNLEKVGIRTQATEISFHRTMSDNYINPEKQNEFKDSIEKQVINALEDEYKLIKYQVKNDELIGDSDPLRKVKIEGDNVVNKIFSEFRNKIINGLSM